MEFLLSFILLVFNLINYEININQIVFFVVSAIIVLLLFYIVFSKHKDVLCTCMIVMCHTWAISWVNIFGYSAAKLQLTWFYLTGAVIALYALINIQKLKDKPVNAIVLGVFATLIFIGIYPLLISPSIMEGLKEFIIIYFYLILGFISFLFSSTFDESKREAIINAYIFAAIISSVFIIFQFSIYFIFGESFFKYSVGNYLGKTMISAKLLMEDTSCSTIMLGSAVFFMLERFNEKKNPVLNVIMILTTVVALAFTTRRTSVVSLVIILILYAIIRYRGVVKKIAMIGFIGSILAVMLFYLFVSRPVDDYSLYLYSNGRIGNYLSALNVFIKNPFGVGYDNLHIKYLVGDYIPHNTVLRWMNMGGIFLAVLMIAVLLYLFNESYKKGLKADTWSLFYCLFAMNFIPDLLNARFFVIPTMLVFLSVSQNTDKSSALYKALPKKNLKN